MRLGIRARLFGLVCLALIPMAAMSGFGVFSRYQMRIEQELAANQDLAQSVGAGFSNWVQTVWDMELAVGATIVHSQPTPAEAEEFMAAQIAAHPAIWGMSWMTPDGTIIASTHPNGHGQNFGDRQHIQRIMAGEERVISTLDTSRLTGTLTINVVRAIRRDGRLEGIMATGLDLSKLGEVLPVSRRGARSFGLIDAEGNVVYRSDEPDGPVKASHHRTPELIRSILQQEKPYTVRKFTTLDNKDYMSSLVPIASLQWVAFANAPLEHALGAVWRDARQELGLLIVIALISLASAAVLAGRLLRPVLALQEAARQVTAGNLAVRVGVASADELGASVQVFNEMVGRIEAHEQDLGNRARQHGAIAALGQRALTGAKPKALMTEAVGLMTEVLPVTYAAVWRRYPSQRTVRLDAEAGTPPPNIGVAAAAVPLQDPTGPVGSLAVYDTSGRALSDDDKHFLKAVANILGTALGIDHAARLVAVQHAVSRILVEDGSFEQVGPRVLQALCEELGWQVGVLWTVDRAAGMLRSHHVWQSPEVRSVTYKDRVASMSLQRGKGLPGRVWECGEPAWSVNVASEYPDSTLAPGDDLVSAFCFPLLHGKEVYGVVKCFSRDFQEPDPALLRAVADIGSQLGEYLERTRAEEMVLALNADLERRVSERTAELAAANQELEAFCYSVSHDLRAPLRTVSGFSQALEEDFGQSLPHEGLDYLGRIRRAAQRMDQLIGDLLSLSRLTRGDMHREPVDLTATAWMVVWELRRAEPGREVRFEIEEGLRAHGDPRLIRVALENLLRNAWKFTGPVAEPLVRLRQVEPGTFVVEDNGVGFDMAYVEKLFQPFQRLHSMAEFEGSGVGLATVRRVIHRHGGRIWANAVEGKGASFFFTLPQGVEPRNVA